MFGQLTGRCGGVVGVGSDITCRMLPLTDHWLPCLIHRSCINKVPEIDLDSILAPSYGPGLVSDMLTIRAENVEVEVDGVGSWGEGGYKRKKVIRGWWTDHLPQSVFCGRLTLSLSKPHCVARQSQITCSCAVCQFVPLNVLSRFQWC
ncbi:hypothetical protein J6590_044739 [Homalodisca vitripennis]|nr:hypothetical protein J6590_044739 [Homalodisca vitripennis]